MRDYAGKKFKVGKVYTGETYHGSKKKYLCVDRRDSGYIFFRDITYGDDNYSAKQVIRRKPLKGWEGADERVEIDKGTFGRVCWTGGFTLYSRNELE